MTLGVTISAVTLQGNGATTSFVFPFEIPTAADAVITYTAANGVQTVLGTTQYTITGIGLVNGGTVTYPLAGGPIATGTFLTIQRIVPLVQTTAISNQGPTFAAIETEDDYQVMIDQQQQYTLNRSLQLNVADTNPMPQLPPAAQRAGQFLAFDSSGNPIAASAITGSVAVSVAMQPVVEASTVFQALALMGGVLSFATIAALQAYAGTAPTVVYVDGYHTAADGGAGLFAYIPGDVTSLDNGGTIIVDASGHRWYREGQGSPISVQWFGAKGNGTGDDTAAIQSTINYAIPLQSTVYFPAGTYPVNATLIANANTKNLRMVGAGKTSTIITTGSTTNDVLQTTLAEFELSNLTITSSVARTSGSFLLGNNNILVVTSVGFDSYFRGITGQDNAGTYRDLLFTNPATNATGLVVNGYPVSLVIDNANWYSGSFTPAAGIQILACGEVVISNCGIVAQGIDLLINPSSTIVAAVWCVNTFFDSASTGVFIQPSGSGSVVRAKFTSCWACSHVNNGVTIQNNSSSIIGGVEFSNCMMNQNGGSGIAAIPGSGASVAYDLIVDGGTFAGNTSEGIFVGAGITDFTITGTQAGGYGGIGGNGAFGIAVATGSSNRYIIANNRTSFNTGGGVSDGGSGGSKFVGNNV